ncbi:hypothetical protein BT63DRAFT_426658 [Microthyrium microscopicum]|uniref:Uncharacterized protein n=1 Tax=Microthyrium microscopicum TaxID=703497 RepID=A0A6A6U789_9PEZI|nr:hypothetical protein BT63DRAFT_426658 [Microthyrium microscopicum]
MDKDISTITATIVAVLLALSFIPQYQKLISREDRYGISLNYLYYLAIPATHHLTLFSIGLLHRNQGIILLSPTPYIDFVHLLVAFLGISGLILLCIPRPPTPRSDVTLFLITFLIMTLGITLFAHLLCLTALFPLPFPLYALATPFMQMMLLYAAVQQTSTTRALGDAGALSTIGLVLQAVIFSIAGLLWLARVPVPRQNWGLPFPADLTIPFPRHIWWYGTVGWPFVSLEAYAGVQMYVYLVWRKVRRSREELEAGRAGERDALLG